MRIETSETYSHLNSHLYAPGRRRMRRPSPSIWPDGTAGERPLGHAIPDAKLFFYEEHPAEVARLIGEFLTS